MFRSLSPSSRTETAPTNRFWAKQLAAQLEKVRAAGDESIDDSMTLRDESTIPFRVDDSNSGAKYADDEPCNRRLAIRLAE
jgi:hypothetical protein